VRFPAWRWILQTCIDKLQRHPCELQGLPVGKDELIDIMALEALKADEYEEQSRAARHRR
jgi:hypothetical protein